MGLYEHTPLPLFKVEPPAAVPVSKLAVGRSPADVAALLPRIYNLCGDAQGLAARMLFDMPRGEVDLGADLRRDHIFFLKHGLPRALGLATGKMERAESPEAAARVIFGRRGMPNTGEAFEQLLRRDCLIAQCFGALRASDAAQDLTVSRLPVVGARDLFTASAVENSPAGRRAGHPVLRHIEQVDGRGLLWRAVGRALDAALPVPAPIGGDDWVMVPAARGAYGLRGGQSCDRVSYLERATPTDHLLAPGGVMEQILAKLTDEALVPLALTILDPCVPLRVVPLRKERAYHA